MKNTGKPFEELTETVFARLFAQDRTCVDVRRDTKVAGKTGTSHQIDVSFSFRVGKTDYLTIVQCKDWGSAVKQEQVLAFRSVLDDIPGQPRGIMVARSGFQEGAQKVAQHHGIVLYELREPKDEDWEGLIQSVEITGIIAWPEFRATRLLPDAEWVKAQLVAFNLPRIDFTSENVSIIPGVTKATFESGRECDLRTVLNDHLPEEAPEWVSIRWEPPEPLYVEAPKIPFGRIRIEAITSEVRLLEMTEKWTFELDHLVAYCFRDVLAGTSEFLRHDGTALGTGAELIPDDSD